MRLVLTKGSVMLESEGEELESWDVPEGKYEIGFRLKRGGYCDIKRLRFVWERPAEPVQEAPAGFVNLIDPDFWSRNFAVHKNQNAVDGSFEIGGGMLTIGNQSGERKIAARIFRRQAAEYEVRFKVASGVMGVSMIARMGLQGQAGTLKQFDLNGYATGPGDWHSFVVTLKDAKLTLKVGDREFPAETVAPGNTGFAFIVQPGGRAQIKDFFLRMPGVTPGAIGIGGGRGESPRQPAAGGGSSGGSSGGGAEHGKSGLFNGKDLSQWSPNPPEKVWEVVDGNIFARRPPRNAFLINRMHRVENYTLTFKVEQGTRGLGVVTKFDTSTRQANTIAIPPAALRRPWNAIEVAVSGTSVRLSINGQQVSQGTVPAGQHLFGFFLQASGVCRIRHPELK
jgi:hypothetical protein